MTPQPLTRNCGHGESGGNELSAMDACRLIANAEELYHQSTHQYTDTIVSTPGKQDGLYWEVSEGQSDSPIGSLQPICKRRLQCFRTQ